MHHRGGSADGGRSLLGLPTGRGGPESTGTANHRGGFFGAQDEELMERHNDEKLAELSKTVSSIKGLTRDIESGIDESNSLLDGVSGTMDKVQSLVNGAIDRVKTLQQTKSTKTMCTLAAFTVFVFVLLYLLVR